jgi:hypothetical protein
MNLSGAWIDQAHQHRKLPKLILDMDSSVSKTYGHQEGSASNGHFGCTCYHPLLGRLPAALVVENRCNCSFR